MMEDEFYATIKLTTGEELVSKVSYMPDDDSLVLDNPLEVVPVQQQRSPEIQVNGKEVLNKNYTIVSSVLIATSERPEVKIDWRIYTKNPENPLIRDLIIEGLSLARTQKEEFASILNSNDKDINILFNTLEKFSNN